ncbi:MAG TPA: VOC family protein [Candidatus Acidoferrales bacterium]|jgi:catechol 2,3-dioxygenase-like lactoylglutathione lyase family enzyme|nr:VOC family protein [Candidatus Acidoferrales bacterium]
MGRVLGLGGVFFKSKNPAALAQWYRTHLHLPINGEAAELRGFDDGRAVNVWAVFDEASDYFEPTNAPFMINFRVDDIDGLLERLASEDVWIDERREDHEYGRFAWIQDLDGNRVELWEPPAP